MGVLYNVWELPAQLHLSKKVGDHIGTQIVRYKAMVLALRDQVEPKLLIKYSSYHEAGLELLHDGKFALPDQTTKKKTKKKKQISIKVAGYFYF